jgi:PAS domain S-box-containing protein
VATILIVDDLSANRRFLTNLLGSQGHRVIEAANGREGLAAVEAGHPDLVITDVLMPVMDGYEFVRQLRLDPAGSRIPVLFFTPPYSEREVRSWAVASGVSSVLRKPAEAGDVLKIVGRLLSGDWAHEAQTGPMPAGEWDHEHLRLLSGELSDKTADLKTANIRSRALVNIGLELASQRDLDALIRTMCRSAHDLFGATYVTLGILDPADGTLRRFHMCGMDESDPSHSCRWIDVGDPVTGLLRTVTANRQTLRGENPGGDPAALQLPAHHPPVHAFLAAPITSQSRVYGWICLVGNEGRAFTEDDEDLVKALSGQVGRIYEVEHEIVERKHAEALLRRERDRAQCFLDTAEVTLLSLDLQGRITLINRAGCRLLGWREDELLGRDWIDTCLPERIRADFRTEFGAIAEGSRAIAVNLVLTKSGDERLVEWCNTVLRDDAGRAVGSLSSGTDITARRSLEAQYQQAQKMEAVGQLAGGVAHDFNNLLTAILGYSELVLDCADLGTARRADVQEIQKAANSAAGLTRQLLLFSRKQIIAPTLLDLNLVVGDIREMCGRLLGDDINVVLRLQSGAALVKADRGQIEQVVVNLAVNARDAMPSGGTLVIETATPEDGVDGVTLTVTDTGTGMTTEVMARLFEPFFTTKEPGKGTGLGLAVVRGIVTQNHGNIDVSSEIGVGTSFRICLPAADPAEATAASPPGIARLGTGTQTLLVVDDAVGLRTLAKRFLERQGYTVLVAADAHEAIRLFDQNPAIDVMLTDVVMPDISGPELTKLLVARKPELKVIYMSGYGEEAVASQGILNQGIAFLHKPFTSESLGQKVIEAIEGPVPVYATPRSPATCDLPAPSHTPPASAAPYSRR